MNNSNSTPEAVRSLSRQGRRLLQIGSAFFLFGLLIGLLVQKFTVPRLGLSVHLLALMQGLFLMVTGLLWPKLKLTTVLSRVAFCFIIYGCFAALIANLLAGVWGAGNSLLPIAAGSARGSSAQEMTIFIGLRSGAATLIISVILIMWGLRTADRE
jgi:hydroxylaminobenzene mutase